MRNYLWELPHDFRSRIAETLREQHSALAQDVSSMLASMPGFEAAPAREFALSLVNLFASASEAGGLDQSRGVLHDFCQAAAQMQVRHVFQAVHRTERHLLDELALDSAVGATAEGWSLTAHTIRSAAFEIVAAYAERDGGRAALRDPLTTLVAEHVFRLALEQETERSNRYRHGMSLLLFDVDNLSEVNKSQGFGAGDRLLERLGISARQFFRNHDWVARHRDDAIVVLLPETALDHAARLATRFREMVQQRLVLVDHKTDRVMRVTVSAAAVGTELVQSDIDTQQVIEEAEAAVLRAKMDGGNRTERVALMPTSVTIIGAARLLDTTPREIVRLLREGTLPGTRRGRHVHIDRVHIEEFRRTKDRED